ncbi:MAG: DUF5107 domain-containing protein [Ardenticatenaceae bacterium]|nr:DUF5107 domain-containing protein [Ardenticatenaceae bacterium]
MNELEMQGVIAEAKQVVIPTYAVGEPEKNPLFLEKRVYQGSSGVVYPYPVIESVADEKVDREYTAVFLENRYLKLMILPELGGRLQMALDKSNGYHFIYYNQVIKPALVGLAGPWISGGIEFNWPQHHRPTTFMPVDWEIVENADGSKTVWCAEIEPMFNTKGMHGFTLYPDRAYVEMPVQLYNQSSEPQTFLWWANPAVSVNDEYQSIFPPDVHAVMDHGKRDVSEFPIARGTYYKMDYSPGTDISRYKNIPVPTSFMAHHSDFDFIGCYDHGVDAGMMHVANHHVVPGKKQWTWGKGDFGAAWDRQLTDEDGPYIELMCGAYTDNQPDFSWLMPGEEKRFTQIFMPFKAIGGAKNANREAVVNVEIVGETAVLGIYLTSPQKVEIVLTHDGTTLLAETAELSPTQIFEQEVALPAGFVAQKLQLRVMAENGRELISYTPLPDEQHPIPEPAKPAPPPAEVATNEELFLHGLHLEQYRHATYAPEPYYEEALRRDPLDSRCNNALGLLLYRRGKFAAAEPYFRKAIERLTQRNPNPYDGEPHYNLGLSRKMQGRLDEAFDAFYKATWNAAWQDRAYFELARLACRAGRWPEALELTTQALYRNWLHHQARHLKTAVLRHLGKTDEALAETAVALSLDKMAYGALRERELLTGEALLADVVQNKARTFEALAIDYAQAGLYDEAIALLAQVQGDVLAPYYLAWVHVLAGQEDEARGVLATAVSQSPDFGFPNRLESVLALETAMRLNPQDAHAPYFLGNFWYGHRQYEDAIACWERSRELDDRLPTVQRNLGLAYVNQRADLQAGLAAYERAFALDETDGRVLFELDQLYKKINRTPQERLEFLANYPEVVAQRDDLTIVWITLLNSVGRHQEAYEALMARQFHPWEGGEGKSSGQYILSLVELAKAALANGRYQEAIDHLQAARVYPPNLGEGKLVGAQENHVLYYLGCAYEGLGELDKARAYWQEASTGLSEPSSAMYYNDQPPDMIFYQGLAWQKLGEAAMAQTVFGKLVEYGRSHLHDQIKMDYFAVSLPDFLVFDDDLTQRNRIHCHYMMGLGNLGLGELAEARTQFESVLALDRNHVGTLVHERMLRETIL